MELIPTGSLNIGAVPGVATCIILIIRHSKMTNLTIEWFDKSP